MLKIRQHSKVLAFGYIAHTSDHFCQGTRVTLLNQSSSCGSESGYRVQNRTSIFRDMMCIVPHPRLGSRHYTSIIVPICETIKPPFAKCETAAFPSHESERGLSMLTSCTDTHHFFGIRIE